MTAFLLCIGDEILIGNTTDTNGPWMARQLNLLGIRVVGKAVVGDSAADIRDGLDLALSRADLVLTTGGLGPTKDDITKKVLAGYFGSQMEIHTETYQRIDAYFKKIGRPTPPTMTYQATMPVLADILPNDVGTAPGMWFEKEGKFVVSMPGVPFEMQHLMEKQVLPRLSLDTRLRPIAHASLATAGIGETSISEIIGELEDALPPNFKIAYLPGLGEVEIRVTAHWVGPVVPGASAILQQEANGIRDSIADLVGDYVYARDRKTLPESVAEILLARGMTISTAESCTGGYLAHRLTAIPGSSAWYPGSIIAYSYEMKTSHLGVSPELLQEHGAVSEECARAMAQGLLRRIGCDIAVAITGIAGPGGGLPNKPVGTVWIAVADRDRTEARRFMFVHDRLKNIHRTSNAALDLVRRFLEKKP